MHWEDPAVQAALIQATSVIIASIVAALIGQQFINQRLLQEKILLAQQDIAFLLTVEEEHGKLHLQAGTSTRKNVVRDTVRKMNKTWSGKFTPGRVNYSHSQQRH
jgi:hypothetical protein